MNVKTHRSFASVLEELLVETAQTPDGAVKPSLVFDYLTVADELHSGQIRVSADAAAAEYAEAGSFEPGFAAVAAEEPAPELPSIEPREIAAELNLAATPIDELGQLRRRFAFGNHPDRVAPHLRDRAIQRMQVANMLIDEAEGRQNR